MATVLDLIIRADDKASATLKGVDSATSGLNKSFGTLGKVGAVAAGVGIAAVGGFLASSVKEAMEAQKVQAQLAAVLKSTGQAAGFNADQLQMMANAWQRQTTFSDEAVLSMQSVLLTFTGIKGPQFQGATQAILDMSTALGQDLQSSAIQVGKALNDPIKGVATLRRVGVQLTEQQEEQIKKFVELGDVASAQGVILGELSTQFGGSAAAAADTFGGRMTILKNQLGEVQERVGFVLLPILTTLAKFMADNLPAAIAAAEEGAAALAAVFRNDVRPVLDRVFNFLKTTAFPVLKDITAKIVEFVGKKNAIIALGVAVGAVFAAWAISAGIAAVATLAAAAPLIALVLAVAAVAAGLVILEQKTGLVSAAFDIVKDVAQKLYETVGPILADALTTLRQGWEDLEPILLTVGGFLKDNLVPVFEAIGGFLIDHPALLVALGVAIAAIVAPWLLVVGAIVLVLAKWDDIKKMFTQTIPGAIDSVITKVREIPVIGEIINGVFEYLKVIAETAWGFIKNRIDFFITEIRAIIQIVTALIRGDWDAVWQGIKDAFNGFWTLIKSDIETAFGGVAAAIGTALDGVKGVVTDIWNGVEDVFRGAINRIIGMINTLIRAINSIGSIHIDNPFGPDINIEGPNIGTIAPLGGGAGGAILPAGNSGTNNPGFRSITVNFNSTISTASPAEMQRAAIELKSLLRGSI